MGYIGIKKGEITMKNELLSEQWTNRRFPHQAAGTEDWGARAAVARTAVPGSVLSWAAATETW